MAGCVKINGLRCSLPALAVLRRFLCLPLPLVLGTRGQIHRRRHHVEIHFEKRILWVHSIGTHQVLSLARRQAVPALPLRLHLLLFRRLRRLLLCGCGAHALPPDLRNGTGHVIAGHRHREALPHRRGLPVSDLHPLPVHGPVQLLPHDIAGVFKARPDHRGRDDSGLVNSDDLLLRLLLLFCSGLLCVRGRRGRWGWRGWRCCLNDFHIKSRLLHHLPGSWHLLHLHRDLRGLITSLGWRLLHVQSLARQYRILYAQQIHPSVRGRLPQIQLVHRDIDVHVGPMTTLGGVSLTKLLGGGHYGAHIGGGGFAACAVLRGLEERILLRLLERLLDRDLEPVVQVSQSRDVRQCFVQGAVLEQHRLFVGGQGIVGL
mmetsp:Transcript_66941/g.112227  ORF Transcript_66941/g.112227 Transcript_66941/m.112227 type:complete len:374 (-) Transcript_66941:370-1491(-)